jgi:hypothetical protein
MHKLALAVFALVALGAPLAIAHHNGHESRTVKDCEKLPSPDRGHCIKCVQRPKPHHYHPNEKEGSRCDPNDGVAR